MGSSRTPISIVCFSLSVCLAFLTHCDIGELGPCCGWVSVTCSFSGLSMVPRCEYTTVCGPTCSLIDFWVFLIWGYYEGSCSELWAKIWGDIGVISVVHTWGWDSLGQQVCVFGGCCQKIFQSSQCTVTGSLFPRTLLVGVRPYDLALCF